MPAPTTNIYTAAPDDLAADYLTASQAVIDQLTIPAKRGTALARSKPKVIGACTYLKPSSAPRSHIDRLHSLGIGWRAIQEEGAGDSDLGAKEGALQARRAGEYLAKFAPDYPQGMTITFCSDTDTSSADLQRNLDFHAAAHDTLAADGRWRNAAYGDADLGEALPDGTPMCYWGAMASQVGFATAIAGVNRGDAKAMTAALAARKLRVPDMLQQGNGTVRLVDWLYIYTGGVQFWLPGAGDPVGPPRPTHPAFTLFPLKLGATGNDVGWVQTILRYCCNRPTLPITGVFDQATDAAVRDFQRFLRLHVDGVVGLVQTWPALLAVAGKT